MADRKSTHPSAKETGRNYRNSIRRIAAVAVFTSLQVLWIGILVIRLSMISVYLQLALEVLGLIVTLTIYGRRMNSAYKLSWFVFIMVLPVFGIGLYLTMGRPGVTGKARKRFQEINGKVLPCLSQSPEVMEDLEQDDPHVAEEMSYLWKYGHFPVYENTAVHYFGDAAEAIDDQVEQLRKAEHYIFMEYYAVQEAETFAPILEVLQQKAAAGVDVRLIYDDIGSGSFITTDFIDRMEKLGIRCHVVNRVGFRFNVIMNNRDHRKIMVIDGKVGYTGGYNLANLYTHKVEPYGFWKDTGVRLEGDAVQSLLALFLTMWNAVQKDGTDDEEPARYFPCGRSEAERMAARRKGDAEDCTKICLKEGDRSIQGKDSNTPVEGNSLTAAKKEPERGTGRTGFVQPYGQSPLSTELLAENVYISILNNATKYCYFVTPYLIITDEMGRAFELAVKRGVDVRIITPGIPDKNVVYSVTRSYYNGLAGSGVRIFEYTPGFCHAKMCVSDDKTAVVGTINLDYRSLYLHFEDAVLMYKVPAVANIRQDFDKMLEVSTEVTEQYGYHRSIPLRIWQCALRVFAPLI